MDRRRGWVTDSVHRAAGCGSLITLGGIDEVDEGVVKRGSGASDCLLGFVDAGEGDWGV